MSLKFSKFLINLASGRTRNTFLFRRLSFGRRTEVKDLYSRPSPFGFLLFFPFPFITLTLPLPQVVSCSNNTNKSQCQNPDNCNDSTCGCGGAGKLRFNSKPCPSPSTIIPTRVTPSNPSECSSINGNKNTQDFSSKVYNSEETMASVLGIPEPKKSCDPIELTHEFLLKQACSVNVDAVTRVITETVGTLDDYHQQYRQMILVCIEILETSRVASDKSHELLTCKMIVLRSQMDEIKKSVLEIESFLGSVEKLAYATAETAYLARAEYASIAMSERIQSALLETQRIKEQTKELERDLIELQSVVIVESGNSLK